MALFDKAARAIQSEDIFGTAGTALLSYGAWLAWRPLGYMVAGVLLITLTFLIARGRVAGP